ncbi:hypothetical protein BDY24DRAFT_55335 [Mrakia frigida]|uniref:uncharacterized protein n=1 Tax=Mrakia frigida TaxID=29902 RepID=UPI003FCC0E08
MNLLLAFVWVLALVSKNSRSTSPAPLPLPLPLILTTNTTTTSSSPAIQTRLEIPTSPPAPTPPDVPQQISASSLSHASPPFSFLALSPSLTHPPTTLPRSPVCSTELALLLLSSSSDVDSKKGGVLTVSAALGEEGCKQFRERLQKRAGWVWR